MQSFVQYWLSLICLHVGSHVSWVSCSVSFISLTDCYFHEIHEDYIGRFTCVWSLRMQEFSAPIYVPKHWAPVLWRITQRRAAGGLSTRGSGEGGGSEAQCSSYKRVMNFFLLLYIMDFCCCMLTVFPAGKTSLRQHLSQGKFSWEAPYCYMSS